MFLNCSPTQRPSDIMQQIKGYTSKILREEFKQLSKMPSLWTRSYFVSTAGNVCSETIKQYVENQLSSNRTAICKCQHIKKSRNAQKPL